MKRPFQFRSSIWRSCLLCLLVQASIALPALAQEEAPSPADSPTGYVFRWLNLALILGGFIWVIAKFGGPFFRSSAKTIQDAIHGAAAGRAAAEKELSEASRQLASLDTEVQEMRRAGSRESATEAERLRALAKSESEKIAKAATAEIEAAERVARQQLRALAARTAADRAAALVRERMNAKADQSLFDGFLKDMGEGRTVKSLADRYAAALADVALEGNAADKIRDELAEFLALMHEAPQLGTLLSSPAVPRPSKRAVAEALVDRIGASRTLRNFLCVVLDHRRMRLLPEIQQALDRQLDERLGITRAEVKSARELPKADQAKLQAVLQHLTGRRVEAQYSLDPALIAGTVVRIGSTIYDGSVRTRIERMRHQLESQ